MSNSNKNPLVDPQHTSSQPVTKTVYGSHQFIIQDYSSTKGIGAGNYIASDSFTVAGHQWAVYFYPEGKNPDDNLTYVSVFIVLTSEGSEALALFELKLVDQSGKMVHTHFNGGPYMMKYRSGGSMWGYKRFYRRDLIETSDYLKDDCLKIDCTVGVVVTAIESDKSDMC